MLVALQAALLAGYFASRPHGPVRPIAATPMPPTPLPALTLSSSKATQSLNELRGPLLLHFWATWCVPCREELPALLSLADEVEVVAVSVDQNQSLVDAFFDGDVPSAVWRADQQRVAGALGVDALPVTFVVDADGRVTERVDGAQRWSADEARQLLRRTR